MANPGVPAGSPDRRPGRWVIKRQEKQQKACFICVPFVGSPVRSHYTGSAKGEEEEEEEEEEEGIGPAQCPLP